MTLMSPFAWLRRRAAEAVLGGVADAMHAITPEGEESPTSIDELRALIAAKQPKELAAGKADAEDEEEEEKPKAKKK